jgi:predicted O-methyltransferase YrrM
MILGDQVTKVSLEGFRQALIPAYIDYCQHVSKRSMAISIETATFVAHLCRRRRVQMVADLGSGFSSYVLRRYSPAVTSIDDSSEWLDRTTAFLRKYGLHQGMLVGWDEWTADDDRYDLIVHDFSSGELREQSMWTAAGRLAPGGMVVFDDAQHDGHRAAMGDVAEAFGMQLTLMRDLTLDAVGRYAAVMS